MKPEEVFRFTGAERRELEAGWTQMLAEGEAEDWARAVEAAAPGLVMVAAAEVDRQTRRPRGRLRRSYDFVARFTGPLMVFMISAALGFFVAATAVMER
ncbi:hypothetical protein [Streptomyces sp. NPDC004788]